MVHMVPSPAISEILLSFLRMVQSRNTVIVSIATEKVSACKN